MGNTIPRENNPDMIYNRKNRPRHDQGRRNQRGRFRGQRRDNNFGVGERDYNFEARFESQDDQISRPNYGQGIEENHGQRERLEDLRGVHPAFNHNEKDEHRKHNLEKRDSNNGRQVHDARVQARNHRNAHEDVVHRYPAGSRLHQEQDFIDVVSDNDSDDIRRDDGYQRNPENARGVHPGRHRSEDEEHRLINGRQDYDAHKNIRGNARSRYSVGSRPNYNHEEIVSDEENSDDSEDVRPNDRLRRLPDNARHIRYDHGGYQNGTQHGVVDNLPNNVHGEHPYDHHHPDLVYGHQPHNDAQNLQPQNPPYKKIFYESGLLIELTDGLGKIQLENKTIFFSLQSFEEKIANSLRDFLVVGLVVGVNYHLHDNDWCPIIIGPAVAAPAPSVFTPDSGLRLKPARHCNLDVEDNILDKILDTFLTSKEYPFLPLTRLDLTTFKSYGLFFCFGGNNLEFRREEVQDRTNVFRYIDDSKVGLQSPDVYNAIGTLIGVLESYGGVMSMKEMFRKYMILIPETLRKVLGEYENYETFCNFLKTHKWFFAVILEKKFVILRRNYTRINYQERVSQRTSLIRHYVRAGRKKDEEYRTKLVKERSRQRGKGLSVQFAEQPLFDEYGAFKEDNENGLDYYAGRKFKNSRDKHSSVRNVVIGANHGLQFGYPDPDVDNIEHDDEKREKLLAEIRAEERGEERPGPSRRYAPY